MPKMSDSRIRPTQVSGNDDMGIFYCIDTVKGRLKILFQTTFLRRFILQTTRDTNIFQTTPHKVSA